MNVYACAYVWMYTHVIWRTVDESIWKALQKSLTNRKKSPFKTGMKCVSAKETCTYSKSLIHSKRAFNTVKQPHTFQKSHTYSIWALCLVKEPHTFQKSLINCISALPKQLWSAYSSKEPYSFEKSLIHSNTALYTAQEPHTFQKSLLHHIHKCNAYSAKEPHTLQKSLLQTNRIFYTAKEPPTIQKSLILCTHLHFKNRNQVRIPQKSLKHSKRALYFILSYTSKTGIKYVFRKRPLFEVYVIEAYVCI